MVGACANTDALVLGLVPCITSDAAGYRLDSDPTCP